MEMWNSAVLPLCVVVGGAVVWVLWMPHGPSFPLSPSPSSSTLSTFHSSPPPLLSHPLPLPLPHLLLSHSSPPPRLSHPFPLPLPHLFPSSSSSPSPFFVLPYLPSPPPPSPPLPSPPLPSPPLPYSPLLSLCLLSFRINSKSLVCTHLLLQS